MTGKANKTGAKKVGQPSNYLILQGLGSPFFKELARLLGADGSAVHKVNYCGGDWWFSGHAQNHRYNKKADQSEAFYRNIIAKHGISHILAFGDCRPLHKPVRKLAQELGLAFWVFEEGYMRPGFITCEINGTNDLSSLPRDQKAVEAHAEKLTHIEDMPRPNLPAAMARRVRMDLANHLWSLLLKPLYFRYRTHRPDKTLDELKGWLTRLVRSQRFKSINRALIKRYENADKPYYFVPLQLNSDYQIREHSDYEGVPEFVREVIASFAHHAPKDALLMFKSHPLDNGMIDYRSYIAMAALQHGVDGRVDYLEGGDLDLFLKQAQGMVLINSTVGYAGLKKSVPMAVLGRALYNMAGLSDQKPLDQFWIRPTAPNMRLVANFSKVICANSQVPGDFFTREGVAMAAQHACQRIKSTDYKTQSEETG